MRWHPRASQIARSLALIALALAACVPLAHAEPGLLVFPLRVHQLPGRQVERDAWLDAQVRRANRLWEPHGLSFVVTQREVLDATHTTVDYTLDGAAALAALRDPEIIDVFVVLEIIDPADAARGVLGFSDQSSPYVVVSLGERDAVLAHELGHYFSLPHSTDRANLMWGSASRLGETIDPVQGALAREDARERAMRHEPRALRGL